MSQINNLKKAFDKQLCSKPTNVRINENGGQITKISLYRKVWGERSVNKVKQIIQKEINHEVSTWTISYTSETCELELYTHKNSVKQSYTENASCAYTKIEN